MSDHKDVRIVLNYEEPPTKPPPLLEVGALAWIRTNLFSSVFDTLLTILSSLFIVAMIVSFLQWSISQANWFAVINNMRNFMVGRLEGSEDWRMALIVLIGCFLGGMSLAIWMRRSARLSSMVALGLVIVLALTPLVIEAVVPVPPSYLTAGNQEVIDRSESLLPQPELAFIAKEGTTITFAPEYAAVADDAALSGMDGFADRMVAAMSNAATNRINREARVQEIAALLAGGRLTSAQLTRIETELRTLKRTAPNLDDEGEAEVDRLVGQLQAANFNMNRLPEVTERLVELLGIPVITEQYPLNTVPMRLEILDGQTLELLAGGEVLNEGDLFEFVIPADGWYVLRKVPADVGTGLMLLRMTGISPLLERTLSEGPVYVALLDDELQIQDARPRIDNTNVPMMTVIDNQFRGERSPGDYLQHFVGATLRQLERLVLPVVLVFIWGYTASRVWNHARGENSRYRAPQGRLMLLGLALLPAVPVALYSTLVDGQMGVAPLEGAAAAVFQFALVLAALLLSQQIIAYLERTNSGRDRQGRIQSSVLSMWGFYPVLILLLSGGMPFLSGADLGAAAASVLWLVVMFFVGVNFRGAAGYGLLVLGLFLALVQPHVPLLTWLAGQENAAPVLSGELLQQLALWLVLGLGGVGLAYAGYRSLDAVGFRFRQIGLIVLGLVWMLLVLGSGVLLGLSASNLPEWWPSLRDFIAEYRVPLSYLVWLGLMFFMGQNRWGSGWVSLGLLLLAFQWMMWNNVGLWENVLSYRWLPLAGVSLVDVFWLFAGISLFNRGLSRQYEYETRPNMRYGGLAAGAVIWLLLLLLIPAGVRGLEGAGQLYASSEDLFPGSDTRRWGGLMLTLQLTIIAVVASFPLGLALALGRRSSLPVVQGFCVLYIELVRGVPLITVLFMAQLLVPLINPALATVPGVIRAMIGITLFSAAYLAENVRGGLQSIPPGQEEAAKAVGLSNWQTTLYIMLPQALRAVIPALVGQFISLFKDTSLVYIVGLIDLTGVAANVVAQAEFIGRRRETFLFVSIIYFVFSYVMSYISRRIEESGSGAAAARRI